MIDLSRQLELRWVAQIVADVRSAAPQLKLLLIGAFARDLLLHYCHRQELGRATQDIDFAVAVADWGALHQAHRALIASGQFEPHAQVTHRLCHVRHGWLDLVPFGAIERTDGTIEWPPRGGDVMQVLGYAEADAAALDVLLPDGERARVVSLSMLAVLKLFAWNDRHRSTRGKDAVDLGLVLRRYLDAGNTDRFFDEFQHLLTDGFDFDAASGWLLGHDAHATLRRYSTRADRIMDGVDAILSRELAQDSARVLVSHVMWGTADDAVKVLTAFHRGIRGENSPRS